MTDADEATDPVHLERGQYGKLGVAHCGVSSHGQASVAGDVVTLADGEARSFARAGVRVERAGDLHVFTVES